MTILTTTITLAIIIGCVAFIVHQLATRLNPWIEAKMQELAEKQDFDA